MLTNHILPELATTLAIQRRGYGLDTENFPVQYPVELQASSYNDHPNKQ